jgi:hypothetical protein
MEEPHMQGARLLLPTFLFVLSMGIPTPCPAQVRTENSLTNADVIRMMKAGIPESIIVREIQISNTNLGTGAAALIELKKQGASETLLGAVLDSRSRTANFVSEPPGSLYIPEQPASRPHPLPSFEADVRLNSTKREKISVGQNHIKLEQSGVPVFSLKWKKSSHVK